MKLSRRDMLVSLLGLPTVMSCRRKSTAIQWEGGFVESHANRGHKLREGFAPKPKKQVEIPCLILGGGIAGLTAAWQLRRSGFDSFRVLELADELGGTSSGGRHGGLRFPWGAHYLPTPHREHTDLLELLAETSTLIQKKTDGQPQFAETHLCADPSERVYFAGLWHEGLYPRLGATQSDLIQYRQFMAKMESLANSRDKNGLRAFELPMTDSSFDESLRYLDEMSMQSWLQKNKFDSGRLKWFVEYACRDDYGGELSTTSAWAGLHYYASRIPRSGGEASDYLTWPEGNAFFVDHFAERIGSERISIGNLVCSIKPASDGRRAEVISWDAGKNEATRWIAEKVVFALPSFLRKYLIQGFEKLPEYHPEYVPWLIANIRLKGLPASHGFPMAWDNVIYGSRSLGYVVSTHQIPRHRGETVWTYYLPLSGANARASRGQLYSLSYKDACDAIMTELTRCHIDFDKHVTRIDLMRRGHAMVRPRVGDIWSSTRKGAALPMGPLHFAHTDLSGLALFEEAFAHGTRAAREVVGGLLR